MSSSARLSFLLVVAVFVTGCVATLPSGSAEALRKSVETGPGTLVSEYKLLRPYSAAALEEVRSYTALLYPMHWRKHNPVQYLENQRDQLRSLREIQAASSYTPDPQHALLSVAQIEAAGAALKPAKDYWEIEHRCQLLEVNIDVLQAGIDADIAAGIDEFLEHSDHAPGECQAQSGVLYGDRFDTTNDIPQFQFGLFK